MSSHAASGGLSRLFPARTESSRRASKITNIQKGALVKADLENPGRNKRPEGWVEAYRFTYVGATSRRLTVSNEQNSEVEKRRCIIRLESDNPLVKHYQGKWIRRRLEDSNVVERLRKVWIDRQGAAIL